MTGQLLWALADSHEVGALYLRAGDEPPIDRALSDRLALAVEVDATLAAGAGSDEASRLAGRRA